MAVLFKLSGPVAANVRVGKADTQRTRRALRRLGILSASSEGMSPVADGAMLDGIKSFQKKTKLVADGVMQPGGPTERMIGAHLFEKENGRSAAADYRVGGTVGAGAANRSSDVRATKLALSLAGVIGADDVAPKMADRTFSGAIELFQRAFNLKRDGKIIPGGATERRIAQVIRPELGKGGAGQSLLELASGAKSANEGSVGQDEPLSVEGNKPILLGASSSVPGEKTKISGVKGTTPKSGGAEIDRLESKFRSWIGKAEKFAAKFAAANLEYFLSNKGGTRWIPAKKIRSFSLVRKAEQENIQRFDNDWLVRLNKTKKGQESLAYRRILQLKDGESVLIKRRNASNEKAMDGDPVWDRKITTSNLLSLFSEENRDLFLAAERATFSQRVNSVRPAGDT